MSTERLQSIKHITTWGGAGANLCGVILSYATGGSLAAFGLALFGLLIICCGHLVSNALAKRQAAERAADKKKFEAHERDTFETIKELERRMMSSRY